MIKNIQSYIMPTYGKRKIEFAKGEGAYLFSSNNIKYLDFGSGIAVNSLGYSHPILVKKLKDQASKLWHTSNLYFSSEQEEYAKILCQNSFAEKVFFTNSGAEAIEAGLKVIRRYHYHNKNFLYIFFQQNLKFFFFCCYFDVGILQKNFYIHNY